MGSIISSPSRTKIHGIHAYQIHVQQQQQQSYQTSRSKHSVCEGEEESRSEWKMLLSVDEAKEKFQNDGTLIGNIDAGHLELRILLDEPLGQQCIGEFAKSIHTSESFMCWIDLLEFKSIPSDAIQYRKSKAVHIFQKYIRAGAVSEFGGITDVDREKYRESLDESPALTSDFFDKLQTQCFEDIFENTWKRFQTTETYANLKKSFKRKYNSVKPDDFWYYEKLGEGGFGFVVHCQKKTTKKHYALKVQTKLGLIETYRDDSARLDMEKQAYASCQHPFIINLDYAFQSEQFVFMALALCTCGDLQRALNESINNRLSEERTKFYVAEVVLALGHLHSLGLMYRDLKPSNILLDGDGHIKLADLGGVVDQSGQTLGKKSDLIHPLFSTKFDDLQEVEPGQLKRKISVMGTFGYMAPEMVIMLDQSANNRRGYTNAVDWWSLGITVFKLLTGYKPFEAKQTQVEEDSLFPSPKSEFPEYSMLFQDIVFPRHVSFEAQEFIRRLLDVSEIRRLGYGHHGYEQVMKHPYFADINWDLLATKRLDPPFIPQQSILNEAPLYDSFYDMMEAEGKETWFEKSISPGQQHLFESWLSFECLLFNLHDRDFIARHTLRVEFGLANEMDQLDRNFKLRQLVGTDDVNQKAQQNRRGSALLLF